MRKPCGKLQANFKHTFFKKILNGSSLWGRIIPISEGVGYLTKILMPGVGYFPVSYCSREAQKPPQIVHTDIIVLDYLPEQDGKALWLKTPHTCWKDTEKSCCNWAAIIFQNNIHSGRSCFVAGEERLWMVLPSYEQASTITLCQARNAQEMVTWVMWS